MHKPPETPGHSETAHTIMSSHTRSTVTPKSENIPLNGASGQGCRQIHMAIFKAIVLAVALVWVAYVLILTRYQLRNSDIISPPMLASTMMFACGLAALLLLGGSALHLLWWFPVSTVLGMLLMVFPAWTNFNMVCLGWLADRKSMQDPFTKRGQGVENLVLLIYLRIII